MSNVPLWADETLSIDLPSIREKGENNQVDFKREIPEQTSKLAKELAGFGTCGGGTVFIGIEDDGKLYGITAETGDARDKFAERLHGIAATVKPPLAFDIEFALEGNSTVVAIIVGVQEYPVFYSENRPYVREKRRSRPATPEEVQRAVWGHPSSELKREREQLQLKEEQERQKHNAMYRGVGIQT